MTLSQSSSLVTGSPGADSPQYSSRVPVCCRSKDIPSPPYADRYLLFLFFGASSPLINQKWSGRSETFMASFQALAFLSRNRLAIEILKLSHNYSVNLSIGLPEEQSCPLPSLLD
jgi:hypothetical protein